MSQTQEKINGMKTISEFCWDCLRDEWNEEFGRQIQIYNNQNTWEDRRIKLGVNWAAIGTVTPEEAVEFAAKLTKAADIAANHPVNGATVVYA